MADPRDKSDKSGPSPGSSDGSIEVQFSSTQLPRVVEPERLSSNSNPSGSGGDRDRRPRRGRSIEEEPGGESLTGSEPRVWRPSAPPDDVTRDLKGPREDGAPEPGAKFREAPRRAGGIQFDRADDGPGPDDDLAEYMHPDDVPPR